MIAVGVGTGVGVNALLSKSLGEKNQERANQTAENGIFLSLCSYAVFLVIGLTCETYFYAQTRTWTSPGRASSICSSARCSSPLPRPWARSCWPARPAAPI